MDNYQPQGISEGVYFHLSNDAYHNDPALSHSGMTKVLSCWQDYWVHSCHNPHRKEYKPSPAMEFGARSGELLLEREKFEKKYCSGLTPPSEMGKRVPLSSWQLRDLRASIEEITSVDIAREHFEKGYGEVSIFWRDPRTGVMLRARIDYLRTFGAIDFKRILAVDNWSIGRAVKTQGLDIQNWLYLEGIKAARIWLGKMKPKELEAYAKREEVALDWLKAFIADEDLLFRFLFQRSTPPYVWEFKELEPEVLREGENAWNKALERYNAGIKAFGLSKPPMGTGKISYISTIHIPRRDYDYEQ